MRLKHKQAINVTISHGLIEQLKREAAESNASKSALVERALDFYFTLRAGKDAKPEEMRELSSL